MSCEEELIKTYYYLYEHSRLKTKETTLLKWIKFIQMRSSVCLGITDPPSWVIGIGETLEPWLLT